MGIKRLTILGMAALFLWGCRQGDDGGRVGDLLAGQNQHAEQISQMSEKIDGIDEKLAGIEKSIQALVPAGASPSPGEGKGVVVASNFASTKEYQDIMRHIGVLEEQVVSTQAEFVGFRDREREAREREALTDPRATFQAMGDPRQLSDRLDNLVRNASRRIGDPAARQQFAADVGNLKAKYSTVLSPEQKREQARALISESLNSMTDERRRGWMEGQLRSLDEASGDDLNRRVDMTLQFQRVREIGELTRKYNIPSEVVRDSGLMSFGGRGGPGGFGPGMGRRGR